LHTKASAERWAEELRLLRAESERVGKMFGWLEEEWRRKGNIWGTAEIVGVPRGALAYAARQTSMFGILRRSADQKFLTLGRMK